MDFLIVDTNEKIGISCGFKDDLTIHNSMDLDRTLSVNGDKGEELVRIESDGTVVISEYGADKKAAKIFYESLQFEGKTLHQKIKDLEEELKKLRSN